DVEQKKITDRAQEISDKQNWINQLTAKIDEARANKAIADAELVTMKSKEIEGDCATCGQPLTDEAKKQTEATKQAEIAKQKLAIELIREKGNISFNER